MAQDPLNTQFSIQTKIMDISKEEIEHFISLGEDGTNTIVRFDPNSKKDILVSFRHFIVDLMIEIERWDLRINFVMIPSSLKFFTLCAFKDHFTGPEKIWNIDLIFSDLIDENKILLADIENGPDDRGPPGRFAAVGNVDAKYIIRYSDLKAFW